MQPLSDPLNRTIVTCAANLRQATPQATFLTHLQEIGLDALLYQLRTRTDALRRQGLIPFERLGRNKTIHILPPGDKFTLPEPTPALDWTWSVYQVHIRSGRTLPYRHCTTLVEALAHCERLNAHSTTHEYIVDAPSA